MMRDTIMATHTEKAVERAMKSASENAHARTDVATKLAHDLIDKVARRAEQAEEGIRRTASYAEKRMRHSMRLAREKSLDAHGSTREFIRNHPFASIGIAVGLGMMLSSMASAVWPNSSSYDRPR